MVVLYYRKLGTIATSGGGSDGANFSVLVFDGGVRGTTRLTDGRYFA
jgi:hypothetical protein